MHLNKSEFFIALILQNFSEKTDIMVIIVVHLNTIDNSHEPLYDQVLEAVFLIQVGVNVLLHGLSRLFTVFALLIKFYLLAINVQNRVAQLLYSEMPIGNLSKFGIGCLLVRRD